MQCELLYQPVSTMAQIRLNAGEQLLVEPGAMIGMSPNMDMKTGLAGHGQSSGILGKLASAAGRMLTGESFFQNTYTAQNGPGELLLAHTLPGDMVMMEVGNHGLKLQSTAFVASTTGVNIQAEFGGAKTFFASEGLFLISASAQRAGEQLLVGAFGGIQEIQCDGSLVIDTGHLVAWDANLNFNVQKAAGGWIASYLSGEGLVCKFSGQGRIWMQTRNPQEYGTLIGSLLPAPTN